MRNISYLVAFVFCSSVTAQELQLSGTDSSIEFNIKNFGLPVDGSFDDLQGSLKFNSERLDLSYFRVTISSSSINTGIDLRDKHLRKEDYLDTKNYPTIKFESQKIIVSTGKLFTVIGILTIKNKSQNIAFPFYVRVAEGYYFFEGQFKINRQDFNVGRNSFSLSDTVLIKLNVKAKTKSSL
jgi:polyisoprenoid-binding protein YceI